MALSDIPATYVLIGLNLVISIYALSFDQRILNRFAFNVGAIAKGRQHYRIFTSTFLHGDYFHLAFNMITLFFFGPIIEQILGKDGFLVVYFGAVLASGIISFYVNRNNFSYSSIGASDGVSGIILSFCMFFPLEPIYIMFIPVGIPAILYGAIFIFISARLMGRAGNKIAHEGHLGGALAGILLTILMKPEIITRFFA